MGRAVCNGVDNVIEGFMGRTAAVLHVLVFPACNFHVYIVQRPSNCLCFLFAYNPQRELSFNIQASGWSLRKKMMAVERF